MFESTCGNAVDHENDDDHHNYEQPLGKGGATKSDEFSEKFQRGGWVGVIFNSKIYTADFGFL